MDINAPLKLGNQTTSTGATAGVGTLPATPEGFYEVQINGVVRKVPFYV